MTDEEVKKPIKKKQPSPAFWIALAGLLFLLIIVIAYFGITSGKSKLSISERKSTDSSVWQAVFLTNNQVYFGHITDQNKETLTLKDVYYLKTQDELQSSEEGSPQFSLSKLGRFELHCPEDKITIFKSQILFTENLKEESKVVKAINEYLNTQDLGKKCYEAQ